MKEKPATRVARRLLLEVLDLENHKHNGLNKMMIYHKKETDYFKWLFGIAVFLLGLMLTLSEVG